jgi:hypothetical protein
MELAACFRFNPVALLHRPAIEHEPALTSVLVRNRPRVLTRFAGSDKPQRKHLMDETCFLRRHLSGHEPRDYYTMLAGDTGLLGVRLADRLLSGKKLCGLVTEMAIACCWRTREPVRLC